MDTSLDLLTEPISADSPCGVDLEYTQLLASFDALRIFGNPTPLSPEVDWAAIRRQALTALEQSRDLRILIHLAAAQLRTEGQRAGGLAGGSRVFDTFFRTRLDPLVDTSTSPWGWKEGAGRIGSGVPLAQFQAAERIRQVYFSAGSTQPQVRFSLTPEYLDRGVDRRAQRLTLEVDGQSVQYRYDSPRAQLLVWPGPTPGQASLLFEEGAGGGPSRTYQGPWALFHLLDNAGVQPQPQSDVRYHVTFTAGSHNAGVTLEATSVRNPFARSDLRDFRCGG